jgi:hypothetical protein
MGERNTESNEAGQYVTVEVTPEDTIESVADKLVGACEPTRNSKAVFDGVELYAAGGTTQDEIIARYDKAKGAK